MKHLLRYVVFPHLREKPSRSLLTLLGVSFGIALSVSILIINHATRHSMRESIEAVAGRASLTVTAGQAGFSEKKIQTIEKTKGVKSAVPMVENRAYFTGTLKHAGSLYVLGVDLLKEASVRTYRTSDNRVIDDPLVFFNQPDSVILTRELANRHSLHQDSKISLATANGVQPFTIRGLLKPEGAAKAYGGSLAIMDLDAAKLAFGKGDKIDRADIIPEAGYPVSKIKSELEKALGPGYTIETPEARSGRLDSLLSTYQLILSFFSSIAFLAGLFLILNSISIAVAERRNEIGILRALGATRRSMVGLFLMEGLAIGTLGSIAGCLFGRVLAGIISDQVVASVANQFQTLIHIQKLEFSFTDLAIALFVGTGASVSAAIWPSLRAARIHPLESMRGHAETSRETRFTWSFKLAFSGFGLLIFVALSSVFGWGKESWLLDSMTKASSVIGIASMGPILVMGILKLLELLPRGTFPAVFHFAHENLLRVPKRTISNIMTLIVGLFLVMLVSTIRTSFHETIMNWLDQTFVSDFLVSSNGRIATTETQALNEKIESELLKIPGVRAIGPGRGTATRVVKAPWNDKMITIKAMDRFADFYEGRYLASVDRDPYELLAALHESPEPTILASANFLIQNQKKEGDLISIDTPSGRVPFRIAGVISDYSPGGIVYMDRKAYKRYWNDPLVSAFALNLAPGYTLERVRAEIDQRLGRKRNLVVVSNQEFKTQTRDAIEQSFAYTRAIEIIALIVGMLGLFNTLLISILERTREIGMLRAVGSTQRQISRMIFWESLFQGSLGALVAVFSGVLIGWMFVRFSLVDSLGWVIQFHVAPLSILLTLGAGVAVSILAGVIPSRRASRMIIIDALEYE